LGRRALWETFATGGKQRLGAIARMGERTATTADHRGQRRGQAGGPARAPAGSWLAQMLARKPKMLVTVALANKTARIVWAIMAKGGDYRAPAAAV
jgi:transposase